MTEIIIKSIIIELIYNRQLYKNGLQEKYNSSICSTDNYLNDYCLQKRTDR